MTLQRLHRPSVILVVCLVLGVTTSAWGAAGDLDPSFGDGHGVLILPYGDSDFDVMAVDPQGRIYAATVDRDVEGDPPEDVHLTRLEHDGSLSTDFGVDGVVTLDLGGAQETAKGLFIRPDGRIVLAGSWAADPDRSGAGNTIMQLMPDGQLDPSFSDDGVLRFARAFDYGMDAEGRLYVVQQGPFPAPGRLLRLDSTGHLDPTFSGDGRRPLPANYGQIEVRGDGEAAFVYTDTDCACFQVLALLPSGRVDRVFGGSGTVSVGSAHPGAAGLAWAKNGRLFVFGAELISRFRADGTLDPGWGGDGSVTYPERVRRFGITTSQIPSFYGVTSMGVYLSGLPAHGVDRTIFTRLHHNGTIDRSFGRNGFADLPYAFFQTVEGLPGELVVGGSIADPNGDCCAPLVGRLLT